MYIDENVLQYLSYAEFEKSGHDNKPSTYTIIEKITEFSNSAIGITMLVILPAIALAVLVLYRKKTLQNDIFSGSISPMNNIFRNKTYKNDENEDDNENINMSSNKDNNNNNKINEKDNEVNNESNKNEDVNEKSKFVNFFSIDEKTLKMKIFQPIQNSYKSSLRNFISVTKVFYEKSQTNDEDESVETFNEKFDNENENEKKYGDDIERQNLNENEKKNEDTDEKENENENQRNTWDRKILFSKKILGGDLDGRSRTIYVDTNTNNENNNIDEIENYQECESNEEMENQNQVRDADLLLRI